MTKALISSRRHVPIACSAARTPIRRCHPRNPLGENPPDGAIIDYALASPARRVAISIYDGSGRQVRRYSSDDAAPPPIPNLDKPAYWERPFRATGDGRGNASLRLGSARAAATLATSKICRFRPSRTTPRACRKGPSSSRDATRFVSTSTDEPLRVRSTSRWILAS